MRYTYILALSIIIACSGIQGQAMAQIKADPRTYSTVEVCDAIYRAEGGSKAMYLYGIRSVHYQDITEAQEICMRTVRHSRNRWIKAGKPEDFIIWLSRTYCPLSDRRDIHGLNKNWVRNVNYFINHKNEK
jgi:hypothetical protein